MVVGMDLGKGDSQILVCEGCVEGKQTRASFSNDGGTRATQVLELVHPNVCKPMKTLSFGGTKYFVTFIDDFSKKMWVYILKSKDQLLNKLEEWKAMVKIQTSHKVKILRLDNGGEYILKAFDAFLSKHSIVRQTSAPYTPQQNGVAERANRTIVKMARCMLYAQGLRREVWAKAASNAVYTCNQCPNKALIDITPEEA